MKWLSLFLLCVILYSCEKIDRDNIDTKADFEISSFQKAKISSDNGLIIAGISDGEQVIIKTDVDFRTIWGRDDFEWGKMEYSSGWGSTFYSTSVMEIFESNSHDITLLVGVLQGGCVMSNSLLIIRLSAKGKQTNKLEFKNFAVSGAIESADGGYLIWGTGMIKLDKNMNIEWKKDKNEIGFTVRQVIINDQGEYVLTAKSDDGSLYLKILDRNGNEKSSRSFRFNPTPFDEQIYDLEQTDNGFYILAGRARKLTGHFDIDCGLKMMDLSGSPERTIVFGDSSNDWMEEIIYNKNNNIIILGQQGFPNDQVHKKILVRLNPDGEITDTCRIRNINSLLYNPHDYFVEIMEEEGYISLRKIPFDDLFKLD